MQLATLAQRFDDLIHNAKAIPLTDEVRVARGDAEQLVTEMRSAASPRTAELVERLAKLVEHAKSVPLTDQLRINRREAYGLCDELGLALRDAQPDEPAVP
jgi:hypothetical protein